MHVSLDACDGNGVVQRCSMLSLLAAPWQDSCKNDGWWVRNRFCEKRCFAEGQGYDVDCSADGSYREDHVCGFDLELAPLPLAEQNCEEIGMKICDRTFGTCLSQHRILQHTRLDIHLGKILKYPYACGMYD